jgi:hypothetical protein
MQTTGFSDKARMHTSHHSHAPPTSSQSSAYAIKQRKLIKVSPYKDDKLVCLFLVNEQKLTSLNLMLRTTNMTPVK